MTCTDYLAILDNRLEPCQVAPNIRLEFIQHTIECPSCRRVAFPSLKHATAREFFDSLDQLCASIPPPTLHDEEVLAETRQCAKEMGLI